MGRTFAVRLKGPPHASHDRHIVALPLHVAHSSWNAPQTPVITPSDAPRLLQTGTANKRQPVGGLNAHPVLVRNAVGQRGTVCRVEGDGAGITRRAQAPVRPSTESTAAAHPVLDN